MLNVLLAQGGAETRGAAEEEHVVTLRLAQELVAGAAFVFEELVGYACLEAAPREAVEPLVDVVPGLRHELVVGGLVARLHRQVGPRAVNERLIDHAKANQ